MYQSGFNKGNKNISKYLNSGNLMQAIYTGNGEAKNKQTNKQDMVRWLRDLPQ
jgi:hypothetical protein